MTLNTFITILNRAKSIFISFNFFLTINCFNHNNVFFLGSFSSFISIQSNFFVSPFSFLLTNIQSIINWSNFQYYFNINIIYFIIFNINITPLSYYITNPLVPWRKKNCVSQSSQVQVKFKGFVIIIVQLVSYIINQRLT